MQVTRGQQGAGTGHFPDTRHLCPQFILGPVACSQPHQSTGFCQTPGPPIFWSVHRVLGAKRTSGGVLENPGDLHFHRVALVPCSVAYVAPTTCGDTMASKPGKSPKGCARGTCTVCLPLYKQPAHRSGPQPLGGLSRQVKLGMPGKAGKGQEAQESQHLALDLLPAGLDRAPQRTFRPLLAFPVTAV